VTHFQLRHIAAAALATGAFLSAPLTASAQSVKVTKLCACAVTGVSADGSAATGMMNKNFGTFRWTKTGGVESLGRGTAKALGGRTAGTPAISADGRVIASTIIDETHSYGTQGRWVVGEGWTQLTPPADGGVLGGFDSSVFGMSGDGKTVTGLYWLPSLWIAHGSAWTEATGMVGMASSGRSGRIDGANYDGSVLVGWDEHPSFGYRRATVWVNGVKTIIDDGGPQGWPSEATFVNSNGTIIVGQSGNPDTQIEEATMWTWNGSAWIRKYLGVAPGTTVTGNSFAVGVSDDGSMVVGNYFTDLDVGHTSGFVWTEASGFVDAKDWLASQGVNTDKDLDLTRVPAITPDGRVLAMVARQTVAPFGDRSILVTRLGAASAR
jgi:uncharacterized membrane protein